MLESTVLTEKYLAATAAECTVCKWYYLC